MGNTVKRQVRSGNLLCERGARPWRRPRPVTRRTPPPVSPGRLGTPPAPSPAGRLPSAVSQLPPGAPRLLPPVHRSQPDMSIRQLMLLCWTSNTRPNEACLAEHSSICRHIANLLLNQQAEDLNGNSGVQATLIRLLGPLHACQWRTLPQ